MKAKPSFLRKLRIYYRYCNVKTEWLGDVLYLPKVCVCFYQSKPWIEKTDHIYIKFRYVSNNNSFSFPVRKFIDVLNGIQKYDKKLIYSIKDIEGIFKRKKMIPDISIWIRTG